LNLLLVHTDVKGEYDSLSSLAQCTSQEGHRNSGDHHAAPDASVAGAAENNHHATHNYKAKTCHFPGFGAKGKITYDW
jgi:hypothetical protein